MGLRSELILYSRECYKSGYVKATDGNLSARTKKNFILSTASNICKGRLTPRDVVKTDLKGKRAGKGKKSTTELKLHLYIYDNRKDVNAIVHTHPVFSTAFACAGIGLNKIVLPEVYLMLGKIPVAAYATPSTDEVPESIAGLVQDHNAILLANHGLVTMGKTIEEAYHLTEKVEQFAEISFYARMLGGEKVLNRTQIMELDKLKNKSAAKSRKKN